MSDLWDASRLSALVELRERSLSFAEIADVMQARFSCVGLTKNACIGKYHREFPERINPRQPAISRTERNAHRRRREARPRQERETVTRKPAEPQPPLWTQPAVSPDSTKRCSIMQLGTPGVCRRCRYIESGPPNAIYCGSDTAWAGALWCAFHYDRVYDRGHRK